jgi:orotidine-5'-phosphate decarboxylase
VVAGRLSFVQARFESSASEGQLGSPQRRLLIGINWRKTMSEKKLCLALDGLSLDESLRLLETGDLGQRVYAVKIHALLDQEGPRMISHLRDRWADRVWVDAKFHDTKDTVGYRVAALRNHKVDIVTVHASGGVSMMREAVKAAGEQTKIWAITVLTSLDDEEIAAIYGRERTRGQVVNDLAHMAKDAGVNGLVCSAQEVGMLWQDPYLAGLKLVVPGTRSVGVALGQQKRSGTPRQAMIDGATYLVAGSQVTKATDPCAAFEAMETEIRGV